MTDHKRELRREMRAMRRAIVDRPERSEAITRHLASLDVVGSASAILAFDSIEGEVITAPFVAWCRQNGIDTAYPEDDVDAAWPDVIVVPGVAFDDHGNRLGQGGGWYDRFLPGRRRDAITIGIGFDEQIVDDVPTEAHDVQLDCIVTESGPRWCRERQP